MNIYGYSKRRIFMPQKHLTIADIFVFVGILAFLSVFLLRMFITGNIGSSFTVTTPSQTTSYSLSDSTTIEVQSDGVHLTLAVENGAVSVVSSDCPDHTCQQSGAISSFGEAIVCVPGRIIIEIPKGGDTSDEDFIIG